MIPDDFRDRAAHPAGKGVPASPEVADHAADAEAVALANSHGRHRAPAPRWHEWAWHAAGVVAGVAGLWLLLMIASMLGELSGGWPA